jgi:hypothetical protein
MLEMLEVVADNVSGQFWFQHVNKCAVQESYFLNTLFKDLVISSGQPVSLPLCTHTLFFGDTWKLYANKHPTPGRS